MRVSEAALRTLTLAQAIERTDSACTLVSQADRDHALRTALQAAWQCGVQRVEVGDIALPRATAIVARASSADAGVAALQQPSAHWRWLAYTLPAIAFLLGLAVDRIANAHRVDLLSPPLLLVLAWNLGMYLLLAWRAASHWRATRKGVAHPLTSTPTATSAHAASTRLHAVRRWAQSTGRSTLRQRGMSAQIAADFYSHWWQQTTELFQQRTARVLHACAAAGAAGLVMSLLLRGLIVRYQFGWESTFLNAEQVHTVASVLFWPLTALWGLAPFSLQDIVATENFAGRGETGARWVWMYVGLLAMVVVVPRCALAALAHWRVRRLAQRCTLDFSSPAFDPLRHSMPSDIVVGVVADPALTAAWGAVVATHADPSASLIPLRAPVWAPAQPDPAAVYSARGDRLRFWSATHLHADAQLRVDAVIHCRPGPSERASESERPTLPTAWQHAPQLALRWGDFGESWRLEPALFDQLAHALPLYQPALNRLRTEWVERNAQRFEQSMRAVAQHLRACVALDLRTEEGAEQYTGWVQALDQSLRALHRPLAPPVTGAAAPQAHSGQADTVVMHGAGRRADERADQEIAQGALNATGEGRTPRAGKGRDGTALAVGTSAGAAAGAAAGAKVGALIDLGTGGMTLGAGTALGALLGAATAWAVRSAHKENVAEDTLQRTAEAAFTHYLVIAHQDRVPVQDAERLASRWHAEVIGTVAAHGPALVKLLRGPTGQGRASDPTAAPPPMAAAADPLQRLLCTLLQGILQRSFAPARQTQPAIELKKID